MTRNLLYLWVLDKAGCVNLLMVLLFCLLEWSEYLGHF